MSSFKAPAKGTLRSNNPYPNLDSRTAAAFVEQQSIYSEGQRHFAQIKQAEKKDKNHKHKTVLREGGGKVWEDPTLLEWDPSHFRLYCGNLGPEVTEEHLKRAFLIYRSLVKTKVVRDKKSSKSKGYGFVSFEDPDDMLNAWREVNGKYVGSHPVRLTKAETNIKTSVVNREQIKEKQAQSVFAQNVVQSGRVEKKKPKPIGAFVPRGLKK